MTRLGLCVAAALVLSACSYEHERSEYRTTSGGYADATDLNAGPDAYDMAYDERHREWWSEHEKDRAFEHRAALAEHRSFCERYPADASCDGWFHP